MRSPSPVHGWDSRFQPVTDGDHVLWVPRVGGGVNTAYATPQTTIGLAPEVTRGLPVAPVYWFKVKAPKYKPDLTMIEDDTLQGSMVKVYETIPGLRYDSHAWDSFLYMDVLPLLAKLELGSSDTVQAATAAVTTSGTSVVGATTITVSAATVLTGSFIVIDTGGLLEANYVKVGGTTTLTLQFPLNYAHGNGVNVTVLTGHTFSLLNNSGGTGNQPPSGTITDFDGEEWRQLAGAQLDKLTIKGNATGLADYSSTWFANPSITPGAPSAAFTALDAAAGWTAMIQIGGVSKNYVMDWEIDLARSVKPIPALTGTQSYFLYFADALTSPGKLTVIEQSGAPELAQYQAGAAFALDIFVYDKQSGDAMYIHSSKCRFKTGEIDRSKTWVEAPLTMDLLPTSTDAGAGGVAPLQMKFGNTQTTAY
jgi:hypothetical protein